MPVSDYRRALATLNPTHLSTAAQFTDSNRSFST
jgi:hypothetical protein